MSEPNEEPIPLPQSGPPHGKVNLESSSQPFAAVHAYSSQPLGLLPNQLERIRTEPMSVSVSSWMSKVWGRVEHKCSVLSQEETLRGVPGMRVPKVLQVGGKGGG